MASSILQSSTLMTVEALSLIPRKSDGQDVSGASRLAFPTLVPPAFEVTSSPRSSGRAQRKMQTPQRCSVHTNPSHLQVPKFRNSLFLQFSSSIDTPLQRLLSTSFLIYLHNGRCCKERPSEEGVQHGPAHARELPQRYSPLI